MDSKNGKVPLISLRDFDRRRDEIAKEILSAAENVGFFSLCDQEEPTLQDIEQQFRMSQKFFDLPDSEKAKVALEKEFNRGWEKQSEKRIHVEFPDYKETLSLQLQTSDSTWPKLEGFQQQSYDFGMKVHRLSVKILAIFSEALGFDADYLVQEHDTAHKDSLSRMRLLNYPDITGTDLPPDYWRAATHTDYGVLTMLFQRTGEEGLEVCPGRLAHNSFEKSSEDWTSVPATTGHIVVNIGDMLMAWSDDRFKSNFHRVRAPRRGENQKRRMSIAYFNQAHKSAVIQGKLQKYAHQTAQEYIDSRTFLAFKAYQEKGKEGSTSLPATKALAT